MIDDADLDKVTIEDCVEIYKFRELCTVVNDGHIECFKED